MFQKLWRQRAAAPSITRNCNGGHDFLDFEMMEDTPSSQYGPGAGGMSIGGNKPQDEHGSRPQYSMPGILHFLQTEWARFEMERAQWEVERAELQVISVLCLINMPSHTFSWIYTIFLTLWYQIYPYPYRWRLYRVDTHLSPSQTHLSSPSKSWPTYILLDLHVTLDENGFPTASQHGFMTKMSCETQILYFTQELVKDLADGQKYDINIMA